MANLRSLPLCVLAGALMVSTASSAQLAAPSVRLVSPIDESQRVTLGGTVHPLANAKNDRGAAPDGMEISRLHLVLKRSPSQEAALRQLIAEQSAPGSANYHKWLTPDAFGKQFGASDQDIATVESWLGGHGFTILKVDPGKQTLEISGNVGQLRDTFHTQIHKYAVNGEMHYANANDPDIPAALAPVVGGFVSLNNFHVKSYVQKLGEASYNPATGRAKPSWTIGSGSFDYTSYFFVLSPADFAVQYDLKPLYTAGINGSGQTIAIVNDSNINIDLVNAFRTLFNLPANPPQVIIDGNDPGVDGINNPDGPNYDSVEAYLDVEWSGAVARNATIDLVIGADTALESGLVLAAEHAVYGDVAPVISLSFGYCEAGLGSFNAFLNSLWEQAAAQGQTVMVATGDDGSAGCDAASQYYAVDGQAVSGYASTPFDIAVGGTDFYYSDYAGTDAQIDSQLGTYWSTTANNTTPTETLLSPIPEQPWNNSQYGLNLFNLYTESGDTETTIGGGNGGASNAALCSNNDYSSTTGECTGTASGYPKPAWQSGSGVPNDKVRDVPDVSLFAADGQNDSSYPICATDGDCSQQNGGFEQIFAVGGTSAAAPSFAAIMALVNQEYGPQGQADAILYPLAKQFPAAFHDVTNGTNSVPCAVGTTACISVSNPITVTDPNLGLATEGQIGTGTTAEYNAGPGYDLATGWGTVDANVLWTDWGKVTLGTSTTTLTPSSNSITHGQPITLSGAVTGNSPTGNVAILTSSDEPVQQGQTIFALNGSGDYSGSISTLPGGSYNIWANYGGDANNAMSSSAPPIPITVNPENSGISFFIFTPQGSSNSSLSSTLPYGTQLLLSARVAPTADITAINSCTTGTTACPAYTAPTGTVTFANNSAALNTAVINAEGDAEYNAPLAIGNYSITASYPGDSSYNASTSSAITLGVVKDTPNMEVTTTIEDSSNDDWVNGPNQPTILTIYVENSAEDNAATSSAIYPTPVAAPTGSVTMTSSLAGFSGTMTLSPFVDPTNNAVAGVATYTVPAGTVSGTYNISVSYSGDSNYNSTPASSTSGSITIENLTGDGGLTSTIAANLSGSISPNSTVTISGTVTGVSGKAAPTGGIYLYSSGNYPTAVNFSSTTGDVASFSITLNSQTLFQGSNFLTLQYAGDQNYNPSALTLNAGTALSNPLSDFTMVPGTTIVPVTAGSSGTAAINLSSVNGFSGTVTLTCTPASGVTCQISSSPTLASGGSASSTLTISAPSSTSPGSYDVLVTGKDSTGEFIHTLAIDAQVTALNANAPNFTLSATNPAAIAPGGNAMSTITATGTNGYAGSITIACTLTSSPNGATDLPTCSGGAGTITLSSGTTTGQTTVTASTTAATSGSLAPVPSGRSGWFAAAGGSMMAAFLAFLLVPARLRRWSRYLSGMLLLAAVGFTAIGCGGGGSSGGGGGGGKLTPTVTVTPANSSVATNVTLGVTVTVSGAGATPTGTVTLSSGNYSSQAATLSSGSASITIPANTLAAGQDTLMATYSGDSNYNSNSGSVVETVTSASNTGTTPGTYTFTVTGTGSDAAHTTSTASFQVNVN